MPLAGPKTAKMSHGALAPEEHFEDGRRDQAAIERLCRARVWRLSQPSVSASTRCGLHRLALCIATFLRDDADLSLDFSQTPPAWTGLIRKSRKGEGYAHCHEDGCRVETPLRNRRETKKHIVRATWSCLSPVFDCQGHGL